MAMNTIVNNTNNKITNMLYQVSQKKIPRFRLVITSKLYIQAITLQLLALDGEEFILDHDMLQLYST